MKKVRHSVFETNSSSTHSITFDHRKNELEENCIGIEDDGCIHVTLGEFGWQIADYTDQYNKLSYLVTICAEINGIHAWCCSEKELEKELQKLMSCDDFMMIFDEIGSYAGCTGVYVDIGEGYVDHQSYEDYSSLTDFLHQNHVDIIDFVYGNTVVHTDNDNH